MQAAICKNEQALLFTAGINFEDGFPLFNSFLQRTRIISIKKQEMKT